MTSRSRPRTSARPRRSRPQARVTLPWSPAWVRSTSTSTSSTARPGVESMPRSASGHTDDPMDAPVDRDAPPGPADPSRRGGGGHDGRAEPAEGERGQEPHAVDLGSGRELDAAFGARGVEVVAEAGATGGEQQGYARQIAQVDPLTIVQGMAFGGDQDRFLVEQRVERDVRMVGGQIDDGEVEGAGDQLGHEAGGRGVEDDQIDTWMGVRQRLEQGGHRPAGHRPDDADPDPPDDLVAEGRDVGAQVLELGLDAAGPIDHGLPLVGEQPGRPIDAGGADLALEAGDVGGDVALHGVERSGRGRERAVVGDGDEHLELAEVHRPGRYLISQTTVGMMDGDRA